jgi:hypothetical protein
MITANEANRLRSDLMQTALVAGVRPRTIPASDLQPEDDGQGRAVCYSSVAKG